MAVCLLGQRIGNRCSPEAPGLPLKDSKESFTLKRTFLFSILAAIAGSLMPLAAAGQVAPEAGPGPARRGASPYKYEVFGALSYTAINQVNQSRRGLIGFQTSFTRDWGRFFGLTAQGDYYKPSAGTGSEGTPNPGNPSVYSVYAGPQLNVPIITSLGGFFYGLLGTEHTGGENMNPSTSFSGGYGGGMSYNLNPRWAIRITGQRVGGSFSLIGNNQGAGLSPHVTWNSSASIGVVFRF